MTDLRDEEFQAEIDAAVREHTRRLKLFVGDHFVGDYEMFATAYLNWLRDHGWRVIPPPPPYKLQRDQPPVDTSQNEAVKAVREKFGTKAKITGKDPT